MNEKQISTIKKHLVVKGDQVTTTSLDVANFFDKKHKHVLRDIEALECSPEFRGSNFGLSSYISEQNKELPMFELTKDGFMFLVMGYLGKRAAKIKEAYIMAFNQMAVALQRPAEARFFIPIMKDMPMADQPVAIRTALGFAYINTATYFFLGEARRQPSGEAGHQLVSALFARSEFVKQLPEPFRTAEKLRRELLKQNPLWSDIMHCQRVGLTNAAIGRICGCHPSTVRKHRRKMEECGLFSNLLADMVSDQMRISAEPEARS